MYVAGKYTHDAINNVTVWFYDHHGTRRKLYNGKSQKTVDLLVSTVRQVVKDGSGTGTLIVVESNRSFGYEIGCLLQVNWIGGKIVSDDQVNIKLALEKGAPKG